MKISKIEMDKEKLKECILEYYYNNKNEIKSDIMFYEDMIKYLQDAISMNYRNGTLLNNLVDKQLKYKREHEFCTLIKLLGELLDEVV